MDEENDEKQHQPTAKRLEELRKKGNFLRSKDLLSGLNLMTALVLLSVMAPLARTILEQGFQRSFTAISDSDAFFEAPNALLAPLALQTLGMLVPFGLVLAIMAIAATCLFGKWGFSTELIRFKGERLNPFKNLKRIFSLQNAMELVKSTLKFLLILGVLGAYVAVAWDDLHALVDVRDLHSVGHAFSLIIWFFMMVAVAAVIIVLVDVLYTWFSYQKKTRMSFQEIRDEQKETDGNPEIKKRIRATQNAMSRQRIQQAVPLATVVITNPTHYAIALRYREQKDNAPEIMAMGADHLAAQIRQLAIRHGIPLYEAPPLARALYYSGKPGDTIHPELYLPVALVLSYLYQLKNYQAGQGPLPDYIQDIKVPEGFTDKYPRAAKT